MAQAGDSGHFPGAFSKGEMPMMPPARPDKRSATPARPDMAVRVFIGLLAGLAIAFAVAGSLLIRV